MSGLFGFSKKKKKRLSVDEIEKLPQGTMLVDCFDRVVGTPMKRGYDELVLYAHSEGRLLLERYEDGGLDTEQKTAYLVPISAAEDAYSAIGAAGMERWNERHDTVAICGRSCVCKFRTPDGDYVRVSSDQMPKDGTASFHKVRASLGSYLREEYLRRS